MLDSNILSELQAYRNVCSFDTKKITTKGKLNEFLECAASPLPGKDLCRNHIKVQVQEANSTAERLDLGTMTRSRRKELGLSVDLMTTEMGCRPRDKVTQRLSRSKTAGMMYCYRCVYKNV